MVTLEPIHKIGEERLFGEEELVSDGEDGTMVGQSNRGKVMERRRRDLQLWPGNPGDVQYKGLAQ